MCHVEVADLFALETLFASSQSHDAAVCVTWVSLRQFWFAFCFTVSFSSRNAVFCLAKYHQSSFSNSLLHWFLDFWRVCNSKTTTQFIFFFLFWGDAFFCVVRMINPCPGSGCSVESKDPKGDARGYVVLILSYCTWHPYWKDVLPFCLNGGLCPTVNNPTQQTIPIKLFLPRCMGLHEGFPLINGLAKDSEQSSPADYEWEGQYQIPWECWGVPEC